VPEIARFSTGQHSSRVGTVAESSRKISIHETHEAMIQGQRCALDVLLLAWQCDSPPKSAAGEWSTIREVHLDAQEHEAPRPIQLLELSRSSSTREKDYGSGLGLLKGLYQDLHVILLGKLIFWTSGYTAEKMNIWVGHVVQSCSPGGRGLWKRVGICFWNHVSEKTPPTTENGWHSFLGQLG